MHGFFVLSRICEHAYNAPNRSQSVLSALNFGQMPLDLVQVESSEMVGLQLCEPRTAPPRKQPAGIFRTTKNAIVLSKPRTESWFAASGAVSARCSKPFLPPFESAPDSIGMLNPARKCVFYYLPGRRSRPPSRLGRMNYEL